MLPCSLWLRLWLRPAEEPALPRAGGWRPWRRAAATCGCLPALPALPGLPAEQRPADRPLWLLPAGGRAAARAVPAAGHLGVGADAGGWAVSGCRHTACTEQHAAGVPPQVGCQWALSADCLTCSLHTLPVHAHSNTPACSILGRAVPCGAGSSTIAEVDELLRCPSCQPPHSVPFCRARSWSRSTATLSATPWSRRASCRKTWAQVRSGPAGAVAGNRLAALLACLLMCSLVQACLLRQHTMSTPRPNNRLDTMSPPHPTTPLSSPCPPPQRWRTAAATAAPTS